jgi:hypothetical protein
MSMRPTEFAEALFNSAHTNIQRRSDQTSPEVQYARNMAVGLQTLAEAIRQIYDKLGQIERRISSGR